jgi:hypothetical protein
MEGKNAAAPKARNTASLLFLIRNLLLKPILENFPAVPKNPPTLTVRLRAQALEAL